MTNQETYNQLYPTGRRSVLPPGTSAPEFALKATPDQSVSLADFKGQALVLVFYPADWSPVCGDELTIFNEMLPEFEKLNAGVVGISVDGVWCHAAFARDRKFHFPLLSDFEPKGAAARQYGAYRDGDGVCERALFVIDGYGVIRWSHVSPIGVNPGVGGVLSALEKLRSNSQKRKEEVLA